MAFALELTAGSLGTQSPTDPKYGVMFDENIGDDTLIGKLVGVDPSVTSIVFRPVAGTQNDRYTLIKNALGEWEIHVATGKGGQAAGSFNFEALRTHNIKIDAFNGTTLVGQGDFTVTMRDVNEAPTNITMTGGAKGDASFDENASVGTVVAVLGASDPDISGKNFTYKFKGVGGDGLTSADGNFKIVLNTSTNKWEVKINKAGIDYDSLPAAAKFYAQTIVVTDSGTPSLSFEKTFNIVINNDPTDDAVDAAPTLTGVATPIDAVDNGAAVNPFTNVTLTNDPGDSTTVTISFNDADGVLSGSGLGAKTVVGGVASYTISAADAGALKTILAGLSFNPTDRAANSAAVDTVFTLKAMDPTHPTPGAAQTGTVTVHTIAHGDNAAPTVTVTGPTTTAAFDDGPAVSPFTGVTFGDNEDDFLTVTISFAAADGDLVLPAGVTATSAVVAGTKTYTFNGKADILSLALKNVKFDPIDRAAAAGTKFTTNFIIGVKDGSHAPVTNSQIKVESTVSDHTVANDAPTMVVSGPTLFTTTDNGASVAPFAGITFGDTENNDLTLKISFADGDGALEIPAGATVTSTVSGGVKTYIFTGKADLLALVMDNVKFNPTDNPLGVAGSVKSTHFTISVTDVSHVDAPVTNSAISVDTVIANRAPVLASLSNMVAQELAAADTVVGTLAATDSNAGDALTYSLVGDGAGGRFKLVGNQILVADGFKLDFEQAQSHQIQVQVRDKAGATSTQTLTINVGDVRVEKTAGSVFNDVFKGGKYNDALGGGLGNDVLWGGLGKDTLTGGKGKDTFVFDTKLGKTNVDKIMDYSVKEDTIWLDNALFKSNKALYNTIKKGTEAKPAKLASKFFTVGDKAQDKDDFFIYDSKKLALYYDADGDGGKAAVQIATFKNNKLLKNFTYKELLFI